MNLRRIGAAVVVMGLAVAACGKAAEVVAPRIAVREAAQSTFDGQQGRFTLRLVGDAAAIDGLLEPADEDRQFLDVLLKSSIAVSMDGGDPATLDDDRFALEVDLGDVDRAIELRMVDKTMFVRADVAGLVRLFEAEAGNLTEVVNGAQQAGLGFVADAVAGKWLSFDLAPLEAMAGGALSQPGGELPSLGASQFQKLLDAVSATFGEDVDVKRLGQEDAGQHYHLTVPLRRVYERLVPVFGDLFSMPGLAPPPATEVPDRSISLDVWTDDGRIRRAELDLGQFADEAPAGRVALRVDFDSLDGDIKAPGDAVEVNVMEILGQLMTGMGALPS
jgi:hypothetical protein